MGVSGGRWEVSMVGGKRTSSAEGLGDVCVVRGGGDEERVRVVPMETSARVVTKRKVPTLPIIVTELALRTSHSTVGGGCVEVAPMVGASP